MDLLGIAIGVISLIWAYFGHRQNEELKKLIVTEKEMIRDRVMDFRETLEARRNQILADRETFSEPERNQINIRIEDLEGMMTSLKRFADRLQELE